MDRTELAEATARKAAQRGGSLSAEEVGRVLDALFGTVQDAGTLAEALKEGRTVSVMGFGTFHRDDGTAALRPGQALTEYLTGDAG
ncbi:hypothetical protein GCM10027168_14100 [Streptomyces capparidis]